MRFAIVVVAHSAYLSLLPEAVGSIDSQSIPFDEKVLVTDGCNAPDWLQGWKTIRVDAGNPNPCRNAGLDSVTSDWVVFFDADNIMHQDYSRVIRNKARYVDDGVAMLYPNLYYFGSTEKMVPAPDWDEDSVVERNIYDTSSAWRRSALNSDRWADDSLCHDDWGLALRLMRRGWRGERLMTHVNMRDHSFGGSRRSVSGWRNEDGKRAEMLWRIRTLGVCVLISRPANIDKVFDQLEWLELPDQKSLYILDNTGDAQAFDAINERARRLIGWDSVTLTRSGKPTDEIRHIEEKHQARLENIAQLTQKLWSRVTEDLLLSIDDDCFARNADAVRKLHYHLRPKHASVAGAAYMSKRSLGNLVATYGKDSYGRPIAGDFNKVDEVGGVGAGFTLYLRPDLKWAYPIRRFSKNGNEAGHDYNICYLLRKRGKKVILDGTVEVEHE